MVIVKKTNYFLKELKKSLKMFNKILIVGCGLIGSSILRASLNKKISKKIFIYEKSKKYISKIKKIKLKNINFKKIRSKYFRY